MRPGGICICNSSNVNTDKREADLLSLSVKGGGRKCYGGASLSHTPHANTSAIISNNERPERVKASGGRRKSVVEGSRVRVLAISGGKGGLGGYSLMNPL